MTPYLAPGFYNVIYGDISSCTFDFTGSFNQYNGTLYTPASKPRAGIVANNTFMTIGASSGNKNIFNNLNCGVEGFNSYITIRNSQFTNIKNYDNYSTNSGIAIVNNGGAAYSQLRVGGFGTAGASLSTIDNCDVGIFTTRSGCSVTNCKILNVTDGIVCKQAMANTGIGIGANVIEAQHEGVVSLMNELATVGISYNIITVGKLYISNTYYSTIGIDVRHSFLNNLNNRTTIEGNYVHVYFGYQAINAFCTNGANVIYNDVTFHQYGKGWVGIGSAYSNLASINCNHVKTTFPFLVCDVNNYVFDNDTKADIYCNGAIDANKGFVFYNVNPGTSFKGNNMENLIEGVYLNGNAVIDLQYHAGNQWYGYWGAFNNSEQARNNNSQFALSQFYVNPTDGISYNPTVIFPLSGWFFSNYLTHHFDCSTSSICIGYRPADNDSTISDIDLAIARDSIHFSEFADETTERAQMYLVSKINANSNLLTNSVLQQFYSEMLNNNFNEMDSIQRATVKVMINDELIDAQLAYNRNQIDSITLQISNNIEMINSSSDSTTIATLQVINQNLDAALINLSSNNELLINLANQIRNGEADATLILNASYIPATFQQQNEQLVNEIYLTTIAHGIDTFTLNQYNTLYDIAHQCPLAGGKAVYNARIMLMLIDRNIGYDDETTCGQLGLLRQANNPSKQPIKNEPVLNTSPNPTSGEFLCSYSFIQSNLKLELRNPDGLLFYETTLQNNAGSLFIKTNKIPSGIYFLYAKSGNSVIKTTKVLIIH